MSDETTTTTVTPELRISQLEERLSEEQERLLKLYPAYEAQEKAVIDLRAERDVLEKEVIEREIEKESLQSLLREKDTRIQELELRSSKATKQVEHLEPELRTAEEKLTRERDRLGKVYGIAEELDNDLRLAVTEMKARDEWYVAHMSLFEDLNKAIQERYTMIESAVEAERQSQHMGRAIDERMEELIEARARELMANQSEGPPEEEEAPEEVFNWNEDVLTRIMKEHGITDREGFITWAKTFDHDGNKYLKASELEAAAGAWNVTESQETSEAPEQTSGDSAGTLTPAADTAPESTATPAEDDDPWE